MEDFYPKLKCWANYEQKREAELREIRDEANKVVENTKSNKQFESLTIGNRGTSQGSKKRPTTAVVAGAKNLRTL